MMKITMLKRARPRGFNYRPRYYDPAQEAREERRKQVLGADYQEAYQDEQEKSYVPGQYLRSGGIRRPTSGISSRLAAKKRPSSRLIIIALVLLVAAALWLFQTA